MDEARYAAAGVDIDAGNRMVELIKPLVRGTARAGAAAEIGGFGGLFDLKAAGYTDPILVAANDGVGTKVKIAIETGRHDTIGIDLVAMSVNDLVVQGAEPLFFLDYFACGKLDPAVGAQVVTGIAAACREANCALIGGETAEMPGVYHGNDYDLAGFAVGAVSRADLLPRRDIAAGDVVIGLASTGVHSNGFLACPPYSRGSRFDVGQACSVRSRRAAWARRCSLRPGSMSAPAWPQSAKPKRSKRSPTSRAAGLLKTSRAYCRRSLPSPSISTRVPVLPVFKWLAASGKIGEAEMLRTFNCGIGMVAVLDPVSAKAASECFAANGETVVQLGEVVAAKDGARTAYRGHLDLSR